jgi:hypothetical protein
MSATATSQNKRDRQAGRVAAFWLSAASVGGLGLAMLAFTSSRGPAVVIRAHGSSVPQHATITPKLTTNDPKLDRAFAIALADATGNIHPYKAGLLESASPVIMAGGGYNTPWTRDAAINTWNAAGLLWPAAARNTLRSVLEHEDGKLIIGGQYWDAIVWTTGAWNYYLYTEDRNLLIAAFAATQNTLAARESDEFDATRGLFRGPEVYGDGVAAYADRYTQTGESSSILEWPKHNPQVASSPGFGLPMMALSTNCAYLHAYDLLPKMAHALGQPVDLKWAQKAAALRTAIERNFWNVDLGRYVALVDPGGNDDRQEAIGLAFTVLFDVSAPERRESVFRHVELMPAGMPVLWPNFARYAAHGGFGRHSGMIWPHAEAFWADAAAREGHADLFAYDLTRMAAKAVRDGQFFELYNPISGEPDGGLQEQGTNIISWPSQPHQTWSATGYLRLILFDLAGMHFDEDGIVFAPILPDDVHDVHLAGVPFRNAVIDVHVHGAGSRIARMTINGRVAADHRLPARSSGMQRVDITVIRATSKPGGNGGSGST